MGDIDLKLISATENANKFQKNQVLEGKISWERGNTWRRTNSIQAWFPFIFGYSKNPYIHGFAYFVMGSHLSQQHSLH